MKLDEHTTYVLMCLLADLEKTINDGDRWFTVKRMENMIAVKVGLTKALSE